MLLAVIAISISRMIFPKGLSAMWYLEGETSASGVKFWTNKFWRMGIDIGAVLVYGIKEPNYHMGIDLRWLLETLPEIHYFAHHLRDGACEALVYGIVCKIRPDLQVDLSPEAKDMIDGLFERVAEHHVDNHLPPPELDFFPCISGDFDLVRENPDLVYVP